MRKDGIANSDRRDDNSFPAKETTMRHLIMPLLAAGVTVLSSAPAYADLGDQLFKLLATDGAANDQFGVSVAIDGTTAIVGAPGMFGGPISGYAYLFDTATGQQLFKLLPDDGTADDAFGSSVAISGATAIVGARRHNDNGTHSGSAYLFDATTGRQIAKLLPDDGAEEDHFGTSVGISGAIAIVGAPFDDDNGGLSGSAYLFDSTTGRQLAKLLPNDGTGGDYFGTSVAISGGIAIIGARRDDDNGTNSGSAYLFDTTFGRQFFKLLPDDGAEFDSFGSSVAISGDIAIVGARYDDDNGDKSGSAYLFDATTGRQIAKLLPDDGAAEDFFGWSVAISGETSIVGAYQDDDNGGGSGSAYLFDIATGQQLFKLLPNDGATGDAFGLSVAISTDSIGTNAIVGAVRDDDNDTDSGSAYLFDAATPGMCPWDIDDSGTVGASDLLALLISWGPCKGCPADFNGDGTVGASDLLALLINWGPCP